MLERGLDLEALPRRLELHLEAVAAHELDARPGGVQLAQVGVQMQDA